MSILEGLTNEQEKRNYIRSSDDNLFVEAGPGAGKTTFISKRIINQIKKGVSPDEFVFLTFTEEAAKELYEKIKKNIKREMMKAEDEEEDILIKALYLLPKMNIMTINRLCYKILEDAGVDSGIKDEDNLRLMEGMDLNNRELLYKTLELLRTNSEYCDKLKKQYTHIYVDEYQDTNELQTAIIWLLACDESGEKLRDGALFVVGDEKQSIYLNEGADVKTFKRIRELMNHSANSGVITLRDNYRSEASVLEYINTSFSKVFLDYVVMHDDWRIKDSFSFHGVKVVEKDKGEIYSTEVDALKVMGVVHKLVLSDEYSIEGKRGEGLRRCAYSDFLIIVSSEEKREYYRQVAKQSRIPVADVDNVTTEEGISILTLHQVKGLSANIVIIADRSVTKEDFIKGEISGQDRNDEWARYEYVAATRARHAIIFMPQIKPGCPFSGKAYNLDMLEVFKV